MIGSTIIYAPDESKLLVLPHDQDAIDDLGHVNLDDLTSADIQLQNTGWDVEWGGDQPIFFDEENGVSITILPKEAIEFMLGMSGEIDETWRDDLNKLRAFIEKHGTTHIYEFATF